MPRGYLKHSREINRKAARGGASHKDNPRRRSYSRQGGNKKKSKFSRCEQKVIDDFAVSSSSSSSPCTTSRKKPAATTHDRVEQCAICLEMVPVICLSRECRWHDAACSSCLRKVYVTNAQKSATTTTTKNNNYPLRCFHPQCQQRVQTAQLVKHNLFASTAEVKKHYNLSILGKIRNTEGMRTVCCPKCASPRGIKKNFKKDRMHQCYNCSTTYMVSPDYATIRALERITQDKFGDNNGWARCPGCSILISKGYGCDHMVCGNCHLDFSWNEAINKLRPLARPPDDEIHLWW